MPLTLVLGPANSAKAGEVLGAFADASRRGAVLVVPTLRDAEHYSRELARDGAVLGAVLTFSGVAREIARRTEYDGVRLSALQREWAIRRAVAASPLKLLRDSAEAPGFVEALGNLIAELARSLISPQRLARGLDAWALEDERRRRYADDLATLYLAYGRELERLGRVDAELYAWRALDALRANPGRWGAEPVFVYGFDDLTPLECDAVETLARIAGTEVTVSLTYEAGRAALSARAETVEELRQLADRVLDLPALDEHYAASSRHVLHHLERRLFDSDPAHPAERVEPGEAVRMLETGGERAEAEMVAAEVLRMLGGGVPADEIVVVFRSTERSAPLVERVFAQYGIPLAGERKVRFSHTALGRGVTALARCALGAARADDLLDYLRSPGLLERPEVADALEADIRRDRIVTAQDARERLGWQLEEIDALRAAADPASELARHARRLFAAPHRGRAPELSPEEELDARALAALLRALDEIAELGWSATHAELLRLLDELELFAGLDAGTGGVLLADPLTIRARRFRAVIVCGLQESEFPVTGSPEPFLSDDRRRELARCAGLRLRLNEHLLLARERYLFYACVSRATEQLVLSYRSSDEEGNVALASPFIDDVVELLAEDWPQRRRRRLLADVVWTPEEAPTPRERARAQAAAGGGVDDTREFSLGEVALAHVRHRDLVSGGALESYAQCPVKWLIERELQPRPFAPDPDPLVRGSFMHTVIEALMRRLDAPLTEETLPDGYRILEQLLGELWEESPSAPVGLPKGSRAAVLRSIEADLRRYLRHEAGDGCELTTEGLELRFGFEDEEQSLPALELSDGVRVRGVIDRVDVDGAGRAIVRDYKSGGVRPAYQGARWVVDQQLQVPLYMLAVRRLLRLEPVAGLYQPLGGGDLRARGAFVKGAPVGNCVVANDAREPEELERMLAEAEQQAVALAARLRAGRVEPCPQTCSREGCRYPGICRVS
jgi:ATP-dependent helicase/DNAse subunit B